LATLTELGRRLLDWPLHPRLARMMEASLSSPSLVASAAKLAALVSERDILNDAGSLKSASDLESDVLLRLEALAGRLGARGGALDPAAVAQVRRASEQLEAIASQKRPMSYPLAGKHFLSKDPELELLLFGFPDRIARRRRTGEPEGRMVGGRGVRLAKNSCVERSELFVAIDAVALAGGSGARGDMNVTLASRVEREWLRHHFPDWVREERKAALDPESNRVLTHIFEIYDDLPLEEPRHAEARPEDLAELLPKLVASDWTRWLERNEGAQRWLERYEFLKKAVPEKHWPAIPFRDSSAPAVREIIEAACLGERSPGAISEKDIAWYFENTLDPQLATFLRAQAPETIAVPTGNRMRVNYPPQQAPYFEVRIQEVFGMRESPLVADGRVRIVLHLLGPTNPQRIPNSADTLRSAGGPDQRDRLGRNVRFGKRRVDRTSQSAC
jgi:ATP-dependent helicase HrpB